MKIVEDGDDVEVYHVGQGQGYDTQPDWDTIRVDRFPYYCRVP